MSDHDPIDDPLAGGDAISEGRVARGSDVEVEPLYPTSRLLKTAIFEAEELKVAAEEMLAEATKRADERVAAAKEEAARIVAAAESDAGSIREEAARAARDEVVEQWSALIGQFNTAVGEYNQRLPEWVRDAGFKLARQILDVEFTAKPDRILKLVERALQKARRDTSVTIRLHPDDFRLVEPLRHDLQEKHGLDQPPTMLESDDVPRHSVHLETGVNRAAYHIGLDELFEELRRQIEKKLK